MQAEEELKPNEKGDKYIINILTLGKTTNNKAQQLKYCSYYE